MPVNFELGLAHGFRDSRRHHLDVAEAVELDVVPQPGKVLRQRLERTHLTARADAPRSEHSEEADVGS
jgi:hypothetical protein